MNHKVLKLLILVTTCIQISVAQNSLQKILDRYKDSLTSYGIEALVAHDNTVETGCIGFSSPGHKLNPNQLFAIGSISKNFVAVAILKLQEQNKLNINDHIGKYIDPQNKYIDTSISIKQLLNHSSGLKDYSDPSFTNYYLLHPKLILSENDILKQIDTLEFVKGTKHQYCNTNYFLLGLILEKVTDKPLSIALHQLIIDPFRLSRTFTYFDKDDPALARPILNDQDLIQELPFVTLMNEVKGAGCIVSCAADLHTYFNLLFLQKKILNENSLRLMLSFEDGDGEEYGLGIFRTKVDGKDFINHTGRIISYQSKLYFVPQDSFILVLLTNNMDDERIDKIKNKLFLEYLK